MSDNTAPEAADQCAARLFGEFRAFCVKHNVAAFTRLYDGERKPLVLHDPKDRLTYIVDGDPDVPGTLQGISLAPETLHRLMPSLVAAWINSQAKGETNE